MNRDEFKTPQSIFTFGEIDDFCKEWGWIHVKEFLEQKEWIGGYNVVRKSNHLFPII